MLIKIVASFLGFFHRIWEKLHIIQYSNRKMDSSKTAPLPISLLDWFLTDAALYLSRWPNLVCATGLVPGTSISPTQKHITATSPEVCAALSSRDQCPNMHKSTEQHVTAVRFRKV